MLGIEHHPIRRLPHRDARCGTGPPAARCLRPALHRLQGHGRGHLRLAAAGQYIALAARQALAVFEHQQFFGRVHAGMAVRAHAPAPAMLQPQRHIENAIAQVGFGGGANARHRTCACRASVLVGRHVRGVHQAPALVHGRMVQQPLHGALAAPGDAVIHLLRLLGNVDVDGRLGVQRCEALHRSGQAVGWHGAQRVRGQAQNSPLRLCSGRKALQ